jgi:hypothetical protein
VGAGSPGKERRLYKLPLAGPCRVDDTADQIFVCERVCTSDRLMRRMGGLAKVRAGRSVQGAVLILLCLFRTLRSATPSLLPWAANEDMTHPSACNAGCYPRYLRDGMRSVG